MIHKMIPKHGPVVNDEWSEHPTTRFYLWVTKYDRTLLQKMLVVHNITDKSYFVGFNKSCIFKLVALFDILAIFSHCLLVI